MDEVYRRRAFSEAVLDETRLHAGAKQEEREWSPHLMVQSVSPQLLADYIQNDFPHIAAALQGKKKEGSGRKEARGKVMRKMETKRGGQEEKPEEEREEEELVERVYANGIPRVTVDDSVVNAMTKEGYV